MLLSSLFDGSGKWEGPSPLSPLRTLGGAWGQQGGKGPALGPPALSSAEMAASWGSVLHLNQTEDLLSHPGQFQDVKMVLSGYLPVD